MQKVPEYLSLSEFDEKKEFSHTNYSIELVNEIKNRLKNTHIGHKASHVPMADFKYTINNIRNAFENQGFPIQASEKTSYLICCNPYHQKLRKTFGHLKTILVTPKTYIHYLSHQYQNPTLGLLNLILFYAHEYQSTDIHFCNNNLIIIKKNRWIQASFQVNKSELKKLIYFIKLKSHLDPNIAMKPQDGSFNFQFNDIKIELRVAALPTAQEEMISLRLFNPNKEAETLNSLGFSNKKVSIIKHMVQQKNGLILIVGTTGSGKSTTLYTILKQLSDQHVITLEDPIEQIIPNIHQTALNENQGYTFDIGLKAILRHNPDVIVIGEIRDQKTAEIALNAAYTGHLVIASLHTNSIEATLLRLENLGCSSFLISYCLRGIISQSLEQNKNKIELKSTLLLCESPYIVNNIKKELQEFIKQNILIQ